MNTEFLTEETRTTTIDNVETTTVVKPQLAVVTASAASEGVEVGDVTVLLSDSLQDQLNNIVKEAAASCAAPAKLRKRDGESRLGRIVSRRKKVNVANHLLFLLSF